MYELALFAGAGGGILAGHLLGWKCIGAVENNPYCAGVLLRRQNEGHIPPFPIWDDVRTFTKRNRQVKPYIQELRRLRDSLVISGGFPCQDISVSGNGEGLDGERSRLWFEFARIIGEIRPAYCFVENSPALTKRGIHRVLGSLAEIGYNAAWGVLGAVSVGGNHLRYRIWICACAGGQHRQAKSKTGVDLERKVLDGCEWKKNSVGHPALRGNVSYTVGSGTQAERLSIQFQKGRPQVENVHPFRQSKVPGVGNRKITWWQAEPGLDRMVDGVANWMDRIRAIGNGQVPGVAAEAWRQLSKRLSVKQTI